jgi:hypothetical protein
VRNYSYRAAEQCDSGKKMYLREDKHLGATAVYGFGHSLGITHHESTHRKPYFTVRRQRQGSVLEPQPPRSHILWCAKEANFGGVEWFPTVTSSGCYLVTTTSQPSLPLLQHWIQPVFMYTNGLHFTLCEVTRGLRNSV